jgi:antitoxin (DNA-binding transcriptional repressor) of toxin-antitoxin stability system
MQIVSIHEAKTQLSKLIDRAAQGESFIIAKAGKPLVKVSRLDAHEANTKCRLGFMVWQITIPKDFDRMGKGEIVELFSPE